MLKFSCNSLPSDCFIIVPGKARGENVGLVKPGFEGYFPTALDWGSGTEALAKARAVNEAMGVNEVQASAMFAGAMFGWHVAGADPEYLRRNDVRFAETGRQEGTDQCVSTLCRRIVLH